MDKTSKIFLSITIIFAITLVIMTCVYFNTAKVRDDYLNKTLETSDLLVKTNLAIEDAGYRIQVQEDGSFKLVERISE